MKQTLTVENIQTLTVSEDEILIVTIDCTDMPRSKQATYMEDVLKFVKAQVDCKVIVFPSTIKITKIDTRGTDDESNIKKSS